MFDARKFTPLSSAVAGGTAGRVSGILLTGVPGMAQLTALFPSYRGISR